MLMAQWNCCVPHLWHLTPCGPTTLMVMTMSTTSTGTATLTMINLGYQWKPSKETRTVCWYQMSSWMTVDCTTAMVVKGWEKPVINSSLMVRDSLSIHRKLLYVTEFWHVADNSTVVCNTSEFWRVSARLPQRSEHASFLISIFHKVVYWRIDITSSNTDRFSFFFTFTIYWNLQ